MSGCFYLKLNTVPDLTKLFEQSMSAAAYVWRFIKTISSLAIPGMLIYILLLNYLQTTTTNNPKNSIKSEHNHRSRFLLSASNASNNTDPISPALSNIAQSIHEGNYSDHCCICFREAPFPIINASTFKNIFNFHCSHASKDICESCWMTLRNSTSSQVRCPLCRRQPYGAEDGDEPDSSHIIITISTRTRSRQISNQSMRRNYSRLNDRQSERYWWQHWYLFLLPPGLIAFITFMVTLGLLGVFTKGA